jgi:hypothetical protein
LLLKNSAGTLLLNNVREVGNLILSRALLAYFPKMNARFLDHQFVCCLSMCPPTLFEPNGRFS